MSSDNAFKSGNEYFRQSQYKSMAEEYKASFKKDYVFKIVVAGDGGVGKTSLLHRYVSNTFMKILKMTVGTDFFSKVVYKKDNIITLQIWDFGGEKRFRFLLPNYCKGAFGVLLVFDLTDFTTLLNLTEWLHIIKENTKKPLIILVGTKADAAGFVDGDLIQEFCIKNEIDEFIPTSAKTGDNIEFVFQELVTRILARQ
jgi:small GTP-binding protein